MFRGLRLNILSVGYLVRAKYARMKEVLAQRRASVKERRRITSLWLPVNAWPRFSGVGMIINVIEVVGMVLALGVAIQSAIGFRVPILLWEAGMWMGYLVVLAILFDLYTFEPAIIRYAQQKGNNEKFLRDLGQLTGSCGQFLHNRLESASLLVTAEADRRDKEARLVEDVFRVGTGRRLFSGAGGIFDYVRFHVVGGFALRLALLALVLTATAYSASEATAGNFLNDSLHARGSFERHLYYTLVTFATIGYGEMHPLAGWRSHLFGIVAAVTTIATLYFALAYLLQAVFRFPADVLSRIREFSEELLVPASALAAGTRAEPHGIGEERQGAP